MHVLVGMADTTSSSLLTWEKTHFETPVGAAAAIHGINQTSESGIIRLVRTACKALGRHGNEQSGVYQPFTTFLKSNILRNPLAPFRGNRFNILFYDAGVIYYLSTLVKTFFLEVW